MNKSIADSEAASVKYIKHVLRNGSFYPMTTFFLISCAVIVSLWIHQINYLHALVIMGFSVLILMVITDKRDQRLANASFEVQLEAVRALVMDSAEMSAAVATARSDNQERSMHAQDLSIAVISDNTSKDT